jgi:Ca2+-binding EF-hand superfamily protein
MSRVLKYKPEFNKEELHSIEKAFNLFADRSGVVNLNNMVIAMKELKFDENEPVIYDLMAELESECQGGLTYEDFVDKLTEKLQDRESQKATERVFDLFVEDPKGTLTYEVLKKVAVETGDNTSDEDLRRLIKNGASNGNDIPYDEFHAIMTKDVSLK